jgi:hypothetical protein
MSQDFAIIKPSPRFPDLNGFLPGQLADPQNQNNMAYIENSEPILSHLHVEGFFWERESPGLADYLS